MQALLRIRRVNGEIQEHHLQTGQMITIGRTSRAQLVFPEDPFLSALHGGFACLEQGCQVGDFGSQTGTYVNSMRLADPNLKAGDVIRMGSTMVQVLFDEAAQPPAAPKPLAGFEEEYDYPESTLRLLQLLRARPGLYAVLDAARDPMIRPLLEGSREEFCSLYNGVSARNLENQAPYLAAPALSGSLLRILARFAWRRSWGIYLLSDQPAQVIRKHLRRFLMVEDPQGKHLYFRYYDPRVLRVFLPQCRPEERQDFFGPIQAFLLESADGRRALEYRPTSGEPALIHELHPVEGSHV